MKKCIRLLQVSLLILCALLLSGCEFDWKQSGNTEKFKLYFYDEHQSTLVVEERDLELPENASKEKRMLAVIEALSKGQQVNNQGTRPILFNIDYAILKENTASINFTDAYNTLDVPTQITHRAMLVYTLTELDFIDKVEFYANDMPLMNSNGDKMDVVERKDILINALNPKPPTSSQIITLYFPNLTDQLLHKEQREIRVNNNTPLENYVIAELIKGPNIEGLLGILPADTKVNDIKTQDGVCQIDLSYDLQVPQVGNLIREDLIIYAMVNSLTEISKIQKVIFLKDGKKQTEFNLSSQSGGVFERNEELILQTP
ncbi:MAG: GerMN domain-containing protein [Niameybacter sp.]|uniref:GerMN domain-containing protein n=1 Tax=Niameybacter sp. TaxID=2033640 RepID=UPI002FCA8EF4